MLIFRWFLIFSVVEIRASILDNFFRNLNRLGIICSNFSRKFLSLECNNLSTILLSEGRTGIRRYLLGSCLSPDLERGNTLASFNHLENILPPCMHLFIRTTEVYIKDGAPKSQESSSRHTPNEMIYACEDIRHEADF